MDLYARHYRPIYSHSTCRLSDLSNPRSALMSIRSVAGVTDSCVRSSRMCVSHIYRDIRTLRGMSGFRIDIWS